ncbi:flagellar motor protein MotB [Candidatus Liberibacter sp.]|uniref:flagellar motor protein MotB n=1 Tax=Candidatus Liberibacter sp. TaxID=34022 RepID=UPI0015F4A915|nr:flagellar motor protein MotB [Candidatus Liberibacter sp.]MBA5724079.1 OmpA family protein [Candidatus Liberibacter sp.]
MGNQGSGDQEKIQFIFVKKKVASQNSKNRFDSWKIAYADFMTTLMSFFLIMWLVNASDKKIKLAVENYFNPFRFSNSEIAFQGIDDVVRHRENPSEDHLLSEMIEKSSVEKTSMITDKKTSLKKQANIEEDFLMEDDVSDQERKTNKTLLTKKDAGDGVSSLTKDQDNIGHYISPFRIDFGQGKEINSSLATSTLKNTISRRSDDNIIVQKMPIDPDNAKELKDEKTGNHPDFLLKKEDVLRLKREEDAKNLQKLISRELSELVEEKSLGKVSVQSIEGGMLVSVLDQGKNPMFEMGSSKPLKETVLVMQQIGKILSAGQEKIIIRGHTDAHPFLSPLGDNWKLSIDRAYSAYQMLIKGGIDEGRISQISGFSSHHPKILSDPINAANRRIEIFIKDKDSPK